MQRWTHEQHMYMNLAPKAKSHPHFTQCVFEKNYPCDVGLSEECSIKWRDSSWTPVWASSPTFVCTVGTFLILSSFAEKKMSVSAANCCMLHGFICSLWPTHCLLTGCARWEERAGEGSSCIIWGWGWLGVGLVRDWCWPGAHLLGLSEPAQRSQRTDGGGKVKIQLHRHGNVLCYPFPCRRTETVRERMVYLVGAGTGIWKVCCCRFTVTASKQNPDDHQTVSVSGKNNPREVKLFYMAQKWCFKLFEDDFTRNWGRNKTINMWLCTSQVWTHSFLDIFSTYILKMASNTLIIWCILSSSGTVMHENICKYSI